MKQSLKQKKSIFENIFKKSEFKELSLEQLQEKIEENEDIILKLDSAQIDSLKELYQKQVNKLEEDIKRLQIQKKMYLFNIHLYEKGA